MTYLIAMLGTRLGVISPGGLDLLFSCRIFADTAAILLVSVLHCVVACQPARTSTDGRSAVGWVVDSIPLLDLSGSPASSSLMGDPIASTRFSNGTTAVADRSIPAVLYFDSVGAPIRSVGRKGKGPGEFEDIVWMGQCGPDSLFVLDGGLLRLTVIDSSGGIVRQEQFPVIVDQDRLACSRDGRFAAIRYLRGGDHVDTKTWTFSQIRGSVLVSDATGAFQQVLSDIPVRVPRPLGQSTMLALSSSYLYLGTNDSAVVDLFTLSGDPMGQATVSVSRRRPTAEEYDLGIEAHLAVVFASFAERREHKDRFTRIPPPEFIPLYGPLVVDAVGTAWVVISGLGEQTTRLQALNAGQAPGPIITFPRRLRVFEFGHDYVLGRYDDELGEVHVVAYRVTRPKE